jgi:hypothetical protein
MLPAFAEDDKLFECQLVAVRTELDNFGLAKPSVFAAVMFSRFPLVAFARQKTR